MKQISDTFPGTLDKVRKLHFINKDDFEKWITCQQCHCTYPYQLCVDRAGITENIVKCSFVRFPRHQQICMRSPCGFPLMKAIKTTSGKRMLKPLKVFCYRSVTESIVHLVQQPGMLDLLNHWKLRVVPHGVMSDIYDGTVWASFLYVDGKEFLKSCCGIGLLINVDWFQPYKHVQYSVGAIYLVVLNLPRHLRYRRENMLLVGIIPGPREPSLDINSFLEPMVADLLKLWKGVEVETSEGKQCLYAALICNSSDIPACRKVGGFVGHGAVKGCSRCLKSFSSRSFGDKSDYSGFDRTSWPKRTLNQHRVQGMAWKHARTMTDRNKIKQEFGVRFTELLRLPYFDTIQFSVIDAMHNILLGTAKLMVTIWKEKGILSNQQFQNIQILCDKFIIPSGIGRIPYKISSGFSLFTADQWKHWTLIYFLVALKDVLRENHFNCWKLFVKACGLICSRAICLDAIDQCDDTLLAFCRWFEQLYGAEMCTPNMHLHLHLKQCLLDYGPACSFWLFGCERINGFLGSVPNNHHSIEIQLMRKFICTQQVMQLFSLSDDAHLQDLLNNIQPSEGSLNYENFIDLPVPMLSLANIELINTLHVSVYPIKEACLCSEELEMIDSTLNMHFGSAYTCIRTLIQHKVSRGIKLCGTLYGSINSIHRKSSLVYVKSHSSACSLAFVQKYITVNTLLLTHY